MWSLTIKKDAYKFSAAHFTIFSETEAEAFHGHNYYVSIELKSSQLKDNEMVVELSKPKKALAEALKIWDEKSLFPEKNPFLKIANTDKNYEFKFNSKFYSLPKEDCVLLPVKNVCVESLAKQLAINLSTSLKTFNLDSFSVTVEETKGQSASFCMSLKEL